MGRFLDDTSVPSGRFLDEEPTPLKDIVSASQVDPMVDGTEDAEKIKTVNYLQQKGYKADLNTAEAYRKQLFTKDSSWGAINKQINNELSVEPLGPTRTAAQWDKVPDFDTPDEFFTYMKSQQPIAEHFNNIPEAGSSAIRFARDTAVGSVKTSVATVEAITGLVELAFAPTEMLTGGRAVGAVDLLRAVGYDPAEVKATLNEFYSPETLQAQAAVASRSGVLNKLGTALQHPSVVGTTVLESAGPMLLGAGIGKSISAATKLKPVLAAAMGEGFVSGGIQTSEISDFNEGTPITPKQMGLITASMAVTTLISFGSGSLQNKMGITDIDVALTTGNIKGGLKNAAIRTFFEGFVEELPQSLSETLASNLATGRPWNEGMEDSAALGILSGVAMGTASGFVGGLDRRQATDITGQDGGPLASDDISTLKQQPDKMEALIPSEEATMLEQTVNEGDSSSQAELNQRMVGVEEVVADAPNADAPVVEGEPISILDKQNIPISEVPDEQTVRDEIEAPEVVGITQAEEEAIVEMHDRAEIPEAERKAQKVTIANAKAEGLDVAADALASSLIKNPRSLSDEEVGGFVLRKAQLTKEVNKLFRKRRAAFEAGNPDLAKSIDRQIKEVISTMDTLSEGMKLGKSATARAMSAMQIKIDAESFEIADVLTVAEGLAQRKLTTEEQTELSELSNRVLEQQDKVEELEQQDDKAQTLKHNEALKEEAGTIDEDLDAVQTADDVDKVARKIRKTTPDADMKAVDRRIARLYDTIDNLQLQKEGQFRDIKKPKAEDPALVTELKERISELKAELNIQDRISDLEEQIRFIENDELEKVHKTLPKDLVKEGRFIDEKVQLAQLKREVREKLFNLQPTHKRVVAEAINLPRSLMLTADMGHVLRQGGLLTARRGRLAGKNITKSFEAAFSEDGADATDINMREHPDFTQTLQDGVEYTSIDSIKLSEREEFVMSNLAEKIPVWGHVVKGSERAMVTGVNMIRFSTMQEFYTKFPDASLEERAAYADYVNKATGRGSLGDLAQATQLLNVLFLAPRFVASRFQAPVAAIKHFKHENVRNEILKDMASYIGIRVSIMALAAMGGADVEPDPTSSDFGKIVIGDTRIDMWSGFLSPMRLLMSPISTLLHRADPNTFENEVNPRNLISRFGEFRVSPAFNLFMTLNTGKDAINRDMGAAEAITRSFTPLTGQNVVDMFLENEDPAKVISLSLLEALGGGVQQFEDKKKKPTSRTGRSSRTRSSRR